MKKGLLAATIVSISCSSAVFANQACDETVLHGYMGNIKDEMQAMSSDVKSGDNEAAAQRVNTLITYFEKSRAETPFKFTSENLQGNELAQQQEKYTKVVDDTIVILKNLENALQTDNATDVRKWLGEVGGQRKIGHGAFKANC
ncbi:MULTISPECIES: cytochrome b562 [Marinomonas]|uniref:Cytochrome b562 n=1 Tax=Marinomonas arctica TaxID=383750 RepID=A0A7H1JBI7_9GAMM|nr:MULTISPECIES: cytochrome b562 [Marinomonas]MCS7485555.1 hypothetical protein [Marinomonas sp. BSi20414]QNT07853.1 hypothetical protein IBG28_09825 [Marinomonas arctica]